MKQSELGCNYKNNLVHLLMLAVSAVGSANNRAAAILGEYTNLTASGGRQKLFAVLLIIGMCAGKQ